MTALLINLKIDQKEKFDFFKVTLKDIESLFNECHIKIRGKLKNECVVFSKELLSGRAIFYQELQEVDWVAATLMMTENIKSRSIFHYLEDHRLISPMNDLGEVLKEFEKYQLDYLCYSFFKASHLDINNLLPLNPKQSQNFSRFTLDKNNSKLIRKISPRYCNFSLASICSLDYFKKLLHDENKKFKIYLRKLSSLLTIIFRFPKYRIIINYINFLLSYINSRLCLHPADSPFNMERLILEKNFNKINSSKNKYEFGILKKELFANFDDDNNAYGESLIKKGLYPLNIEEELKVTNQNYINFSIKLKVREVYDCTYYSQIHRIRDLPKIFIKVNYGKLLIKYNGKNIKLIEGSNQGFYTNLSPIINCLEDSEVQVSVYDECF